MKWSVVNVSILADLLKKECGIGHEEEAVFSLADGLGITASRAKAARCGLDPYSRDNRATLLSMEEALFGHGVSPDPGTEATL